MNSKMNTILKKVIYRTYGFRNSVLETCAPKNLNLSFKRKNIPKKKKSLNCLFKDFCGSCKSFNSDFGVQISNSYQMSLSNALDFLLGPVSYEPIDAPRNLRYARNSPKRLASSDVNSSTVNADRNKRILDLTSSFLALFAAPYSGSLTRAYETHISFRCTSNIFVVIAGKFFIRML